MKPSYLTILEMGGAIYALVGMLLIDPASYDAEWMRLGNCRIGERLLLFLRGGDIETESASQLISCWMILFPGLFEVVGSDSHFIIFALSSVE